MVVVLGVRLMGWLVVVFFIFSWGGAATVVPLAYIAANTGDHDDNGSGPRNTID